MRALQSRVLAAAVTAILLSVLEPASQAAPADQCGVWRWSVKTLSDAAAEQVDFTPRARTVNHLRQLNPPDALGTNTPRIGPHELRVYRIRARLIAFKRERDRDFHVVISQVNNASRTMVTEVVDPTCPGAQDSARVGTLQAVRQEFIGLYGTPPSSGFREVPGRPVAIIVGVGFWDLCTGAHKPHGAAPNCIELHPVLDIDPVSP